MTSALPMSFHVARFFRCRASRMLRSMPFSQKSRNVSSAAAMHTRCVVVSSLEIDIPCLVNSA